MIDFYENINKESLGLYEDTILKVLDAADISISTISPSEWAEQNRVMGKNTPVPGRFSFENAPYCREILDCGTLNHPGKKFAIMKGVQIAMSTSFIQNLIGYNIAENPHNMMLLVGHDDLIKDSVERIDDVIDNCGLRHKIRSSASRARKTQSGDTDKKKEFQDGYLMIGLANHKTLRQVSIQTMIVDDFDAMKSDTKEAGSTTAMIEARTTAFAKKMKIFYVSTPELKENSNIESVYLLGDQRRYFIPCPCCNEQIVLEWETTMENDENIPAGITYDVDHEGYLITESVGYKCQKCGDFFDDSTKTEMLLAGEWIPTAKPSDPEYYSYQISALYAPIYMRDWTSYVRQYLEANPFNGERNHAKHQTFVNLVLGLPYEYEGSKLSANALQKNCRKYEIGIIPEKQSIADGNGKIVMVTAGFDMNGKEKDGRMDYEIVAYSESGAEYSINEGSIGTFIPKDKNPNLREHYTYHHGSRRSIWIWMEKLLTTRIKKDTGGTLPIFATGLDAGYLPNYAYQFTDKTNGYNVYCLKGDPQKHLREDGDYKTYRRSKDRGNLYLVESNHTKTLLEANMGLNWDKDIHDVQPFGFMNFPNPSNNKYGFKDFFSHFEAETKMMGRDGKFIWKKQPGKQNHKFDCRLYANVARDIVLDAFFKSRKMHNGVWSDYCNFFKKKKPTQKGKVSK